MPYLEDDYNDILQKARQGKRFSIRAVSDRAGVAPHEIVAIEEGRAVPTEKLAVTLGLSFEKLQNIYHKRYMPQDISDKISEDLLLKRFEVTVHGIVSNTYVLIRGHYGLLVDSVGASKEALRFLETEGIEPRYVLITHGHFDHIAGIEHVAKIYPQATALYAGRDSKEDTQFETLGFTIHVLRTPGHTEDAVCYLVNDTILFVGDTIFAGSVGRPNYDYEILLKNIKEKIFTLPDTVVLAPGHGPLTTVGKEKEHNPFFRQ